jgi:HAD superfamily hydrolase (TIGR01509 family)
MGITDKTPEELLETRDKMMLDKMNRDLKPMPGLYDILDAFRGKKKMAVVTGNVGVFLELVLKKLEIGKYFDVIQTSENIANGKPDPEIYLAAIRRLDVPPANCAVLEDSVNGARAGKSAGCYVIAVPSEYTHGHDFTFADYRASGLSDAKNHLLGLERNA